MTCRELIVYILANNLEDDPVFQHGKLVGFLTPYEVAVELNVGMATIRTWMSQGRLSTVCIGGVPYIPANYNVHIDK